ncbi:MAG: hypothetical protein AAFQ94_09265 [Bacteroidota bacterium]
MSTETIPLIPSSEANALYLKSSGKKDRIDCILSNMSTLIRENARSDRSFAYYRFTKNELDLKDEIIEILTNEVNEFTVEPDPKLENIIKIIYG